MRSRFFFRLIFFFMGFSWSVGGVDFNTIEQQLKGDGLEGEIHGANPSLGLYVFVYREPEDFFDFAEFPLLARTKELQDTFATLQRHDRISIKGVFANTKAPIRHILVSDLSVVKKFENGLPVPQYKYEAKLPPDLIGKTHFQGKVHAVSPEAKVLVVEYKDAVIPVYVEQAELLKDLYRNDKIVVHFQMRAHPDSPLHIELAKNVKTPILVTDSMRAWHGKSATLEGDLVLFPKSPQVIFNVFAIEQIDQQGIERTFTLVNFDDPKLFSALRKKLQDRWDAHPEGIKNSRNKYVNHKVRVRAIGTFNVVDPGQANPQILLNNVNSIEFIEPVEPIQTTKKNAQFLRP